MTKTDMQATGDEKIILENMDEETKENVIEDLTDAGIKRGVISERRDHDRRWKASLALIPSFLMLAVFIAAINYLEHAMEYRERDI